MPRHAARYLVTIAAALCAWLIAAEARAAGPACANASDVVRASVSIPWIFPVEGATGDVQMVPEAPSDAPAADADAAAADERGPVATIAFGASRAEIERAVADACAAGNADLRDARGAPMCGRHGSSVNAPAPFLETTQRANGIARSSGSTGNGAADDSCAGQMIGSSRPGTLHRSAPRVDADPSQPSCALPLAMVVGPAASAFVAPPSAEVFGARSGVKMQLERPPR